MYYHILIETKEKVKSGKTTKNKEILETNKVDLLEIEERIVKPFLQKETIHFNGFFLEPSEINRISIKETQIKISDIINARYASMPRNVFVNISPINIISGDSSDVNDITKTIFDKVKETIKPINYEAKKTAFKLQNTSPVINISGTGHNIVTHSHDFEQHITNSDTSIEIFDKILDALKDIQDQQISVLFSDSAKEMKMAHGTANFSTKYKEFMSLFSDHITVAGAIVAPYLPALAQLVTQV
jgi:hypothetical protein